MEQSFFHRRPIATLPPKVAYPEPKVAYPEPKVAMVRTLLKVTRRHMDVEQFWLQYGLMSQPEGSFLAVFLHHCHNLIRFAFRGV
jgi:hypothetical protein